MIHKRRFVAGSICPCSSGFFVLLYCKYIFPLCSVVYRLENCLDIIAVHLEMATEGQKEMYRGIEGAEELEMTVK